MLLTNCQGRAILLHYKHNLSYPWGLQHVIKSREWKLLRFKHQFVIPGKHQFTITVFYCNYGHENALDCPHLCCRLGALYLTLAIYDPGGFVFYIISDFIIKNKHSLWLHKYINNLPCKKWRGGSSYCFTNCPIKNLLPKSWDFINVPYFGRPIS